MRIKLLPLFLGSVLLASCTSGGAMMNHQMNGMGNGGMQNGMMNSTGTQQEGFLPSEGKDIRSLAAAKPTETIDVSDGETISLNPTVVRKTINGREIAMYGYNGEIPGPLLRVKQGATFTVNVTNNIDLPTSIHWHGLRLGNESDGAVGVTQQEIKPGGSFSYTVKVPDEGIYWYHPHVREDVEQDLGLYGNILVTPTDANSYNPVNREELVMLDDILLANDFTIVPFGTVQANHAMMGRYGNDLQVNGDKKYELHAEKGEVVRFYFTNAANARPFRVRILGSGPNQTYLPLKLVGGDSGRYENETMTDSITLSPSERAIVEVLLPESGIYNIMHEPTLESPRIPPLFLGHIYVADEPASSSYASQFATLRTNDDVARSIDPFRSSFNKPIDHTLALDMSMMSGNMGGQGMMGPVPADGIEWEDDAGMMNAGMMGNMMQWKLIDQATGAANKDLLYTAKVGDKVKIRIINKKDSAHPMQHPIHFHGQRFLVLSDNGVASTDFVWKDTALVPAGHTVDILLDASNPGDWMFHCHIAEHLSNGMMGMLRIQ